jgi:hypothetical protein
MNHPRTLVVVSEAGRSRHQAAAPRCLSRSARYRHPHGDATTVQLTTVTSAGAVDRLLLAFGGCGGR